MVPLRMTLNDLSQTRRVRLSARPSVPRWCRFKTNSSCSFHRWVTMSSSSDWITTRLATCTLP